MEFLRDLQTRESRLREVNGMEFLRDLETRESRLREVQDCRKGGSRELSKGRCVYEQTLGCNPRFNLAATVVGYVVSFAVWAGLHFAWRYRPPVYS